MFQNLGARHSEKMIILSYPYSTNLLVIFVYTRIPMDFFPQIKVTRRNIIVTARKEITANFETLAGFTTSTFEVLASLRTLNVCNRTRSFRKLEISLGFTRFSITSVSVAGVYLDSVPILPWQWLKAINSPCDNVYLSYGIVFLKDIVACITRKRLFTYINTTGVVF